MSTSGRLVVLEGLDGVGKSTQLGLLTKRLEAARLPFVQYTFPRYQEPPVGWLISRFLRGEFGGLAEVDPHLVSMLYALDRAGAAPALRAALESGVLVVVDRYVLSNVAYQGAKVEEGEARERFITWLLELEYGVLGVPVPDLHLYLASSAELVARRNRDRGEHAGERGYLAGAEDIHERDSGFQANVDRVYRAVLPRLGAHRILECSDRDGVPFAREGLGDQVWEALFER